MFLFLRCVCVKDTGYSNFMLAVRVGTAVLLPRIAAACCSLGSWICVNLPCYGEIRVALTVTGQSLTTNLI